MEQLKEICKNPWCKATFYYKEEDMIEVVEDKRTSKLNSLLNEVKKVPPTTCPKCRSFDSELSGGVTWTEKKYEGDRFDGTPHQFSYKITNFR